MLTIFTIPKSFKGQADFIQRNAIQSWLKMSSECEIILFGDDEGAEEAAREFNVLHIPEIKKTKFGTPLVNDVFEKAQQISKNKILTYINADIILTSDFLKAVKMVTFSRFLMVGRRRDFDVKKAIDFNEINWEQKLKDGVKKEGKLHGPAGIDYFIFSKGIWNNIPSFVIGRNAFDNWLLYKAWISKIPIIDATEMIMAVHQNHCYPPCPTEKTKDSREKEFEINLKESGGLGHLLTIRDADWILTPSGLKKPKLTLYRIFSFPFRYFERLPAFKIFLFPGWLGMTGWRKIRKILKK